MFTAAAAPGPFAAVRGTYFGLFAVTNHGTAPGAGGFTFTTTASGSFSGLWQLGAERLRVKGRFDGTGNFSTSVARPHLEPLTITLKLDVAGGSTQVSGSVSNGGWTAVLSGERAVFTGGRHSAPAAGRYTLMIPGDCAASNAPCGDSYGTLSVSKSGSVRLSGVLADGTKFTQSASVSTNGQWPLYAPLYDGLGWVWGWLTFTNPPTGDVGGELSWFKPPVQRTKYYPSGFALTTLVRGSAYLPVRGRGAQLLAGTNVSAVFSGGSLAQELLISGRLSAGNRVKLDNHSSLSFSTSTGTFRGSTRDPATHKSMSFGGVVLQRKSLGCGCFLEQNLSGRVRLGATDTGFVVRFQTLGDTFAPTVDNDGVFGEIFYWRWSDGTLSSEYPFTLKEFGSAQPRDQYLTVYPPGAVVAINLGFGREDGGDQTPLPTRPPQNVGAVYFPAPLPGLRYWASSYNPITNTLDFTGFSSLEIIECYECARLQHVKVANLPSLRRVCLEACNLQELDLSGNPNLEDVRAAANQYTNIVLGEGTGPKIWHWCVRDNPQLTRSFEEVHRNFYSLMDFFAWNDNQSGALRFVSTNLVSVQAQYNAYTSADLSDQPRLTTCLLYGNRLTNLVFTTCSSLELFDAHANQLPTEVMDQLLEVLDTTGTNLVQVDLTHNAGPPSSAGLVHYQNLVNRGVDVRVDF